MRGKGRETRGPSYGKTRTVSGRKWWRAPLRSDFPGSARLEERRIDHRKEGFSEVLPQNPVEALHAGQKKVKRKKKKLEERVEEEIQKRSSVETTASKRRGPAGLAPF